MKIITISREFGSGGREIGKRLAEALGFDYYDRELISAIAKNQNLDEDYVEKVLDNQGAVSAPLTFSHSFSSPVAITSTQIGLLLEQNKVIENIAKRGRDFVIVGRNADVILEDYNPFNIFVCANMDAKIRRCEERAEQGEQLSRKKMERKIKRIDKNRKKSRAILAASTWGDRASYHLIVNTSNWKIQELIPAIQQFAKHFWEKT